MAVTSVAITGNDIFVCVYLPLDVHENLRIEMRYSDQAT